MLAQQTLHSFLALAPRWQLLFRVIAAVAGASSIVFFGVGCSAEAKTARHLARGKQYFQAGEFEKAEIEFKNVLRVDASNPDAVSHLGIIFYEQGRMGMTYALLTKGATLQPDNVDVRLKLGMLQASTGQHQAAREHALFVLERRPGDEDAPILLAGTATNPKEAEEIRLKLRALPSAGGVPVLLALGLIDIRENKLNEAEASLRKAAELAPKSGIVSYAMGALHVAQKDLPKAEQAYATAAGLAPFRSQHRVRYAQFSLQNGRVDAAKKTLTEVTEKAADFIPAWVLLATIAATEKKYDEGLASLNKVLALDPAHYNALLLHARLRFEKGEKDRAVAELELMTKLFPKSAEMFAQLGTSYWLMGNVEKAAEGLTQAVALAPDNPGTVMFLAEVNSRLGKLELATSSLKQLVQKQPALADARLALAQALRVQGKLDEALATYDQIDSAFGRNPQPSYRKGLILLQQKKTAEARAAFARAIEIEPGYRPALEALVNFELIEKKYDSARQRVEAEIAKSPQSPELQLLLAKVYVAAADMVKGEAALRRVIELQPDSPIGYLLLARIYLGGSQKDKALASLQDAVAKDPRNVEALLLMAAMREQQDDYGRARENYEKVLAINPKSVVALNNLAYIYSERFNELDKALQSAQRARDLLPSDPRIADTLGWVAYRKRQYTWALTLLSESAEKIPDVADVQYHLGMAYYMMGDEEAAHAALERALAISTTFLGADDARHSLAILAIDPKAGGARSQATLEKAVTDRPHDAVALTRLGLIHEQSGALDKASGAFSAALKANPNNLGAAMNMIRIHLARKDTASALELAKATRKLAPDDPQVAHTLGRLAFASGDHTWSLSLLQESARRQSDDPEILYDLAMAAYSKGQVPAAETALSDALKANPRFPHASQAQGYLEMIGLATDPSKATAAEGKIRQRLKEDPADVPALMALAAIQEQRADLDAARKTYESTLVRYPDFSPAMRRLTIMHSNRGGTDSKAVERAVKAREAYPQDASLAKAFGIIVFRQGNYTRAANLLQESSRELTADAEVAYYTGMAQHFMKDRVASVASLRRALDLGLKSDLATEAKKILAASGKL